MISLNANRKTMLLNTMLASLLLAISACDDSTKDIVSPLGSEQIAASTNTPPSKKYSNNDQLAVAVITQYAKQSPAYSIRPCFSSIKIGPTLCANTI